jgi:hypothetical protein
LRAACTAVALNLGGWDKRSNVKNQKIQAIPTAPCGIAFVPAQVVQLTLMICEQGSDTWNIDRIPLLWRKTTGNGRQQAVFRRYPGLTR